MSRPFVIVGCPRCKTVQVVQARSKTHSCASCGRRFELEGLKVLGSAGNAREARVLVSELKAREASPDQR